MLSDPVVAIPPSQLGHSTDDPQDPRSLSLNKDRNPPFRPWFIPTTGWLKEGRLSSGIRSRVPTVPACHSQRTQTEKIKPLKPSQSPHPNLVIPTGQCRRNSGRRSWNLLPPSQTLSFHLFPSPSTGPSSCRNPHQPDLVQSNRWEPDTPLSFRRRVAIPLHPPWSFQRLIKSSRSLGRRQKSHNPTSYLSSNHINHKIYLASSCRTCATHPTMPTGQIPTARRPTPTSSCLLIQHVAISHTLPPPRPGQVQRNAVPV